MCCRVFNSLLHIGPSQNKLNAKAKCYFVLVIVKKKQLDYIFSPSKDNMQKMDFSLKNNSNL